MASNQPLRRHPRQALFETHPPLPPPLPPPPPPQSADDSDLECLATSEEMPPRSSSLEVPSTPPEMAAESKMRSFATSPEALSTVIATEMPTIPGPQRTTDIVENEMQEHASVIQKDVAVRLQFSQEAIHPRRHRGVLFETLPPLPPPPQVISRTDVAPSVPSAATPLLASPCTSSCPQALSSSSPEKVAPTKVAVAERRRPKPQERRRSAANAADPSACGERHASRGHREERLGSTACRKGPRRFRKACLKPQPKPENVHGCVTISRPVDSPQAKTSEERVRKAYLSDAASRVRRFLSGSFVIGYCLIIGYVLFIFSGIRQSDQNARCLKLKCPSDSICVHEGSGLSYCNFVRYRDKQTIKLVLAILIGVPALVCVPFTLQCIFRPCRRWCSCRNSLVEVPSEATRSRLDSEAALAGRQATTLTF
eukprot:TRINITY_DN9823_c0_g1_i1.p1 TRINITY_DN9823_c0_g1~~TRINITY_DN9823_c0_g1_i1.p1  ORF type:complete len:461 (-),score=55.04 TRINITY_DN9823_c0_g1_i1:50-1327(-)